MIKILLNVMVLIFYILTQIFFLIWNGKLLKVSPYHFMNSDGPTPDFSDTMDPKWQSENYTSEKTEKQMKFKVLNDIISSEDYKTKLRRLEVPIYEDGKKIGTSTVYSVLNDIVAKS
jgi:hypothetical protein